MNNYKQNLLKSDGTVMQDFGFWILSSSGTGFEKNFSRWNVSVCPTGNDKFTAFCLRLLRLCDGAM